MADVFISYSHDDRHIAVGLAAFLDDCGYSVWWDYELVGGTKFRKKIEEQLILAKAAIVIWTPDSIESDFVNDEADMARKAGKLIPTRVVGIEDEHIPLGFRQLQTNPVTKPDLLLRSLDEHGVKPSKPPVKRHAAPVVIGQSGVDPLTVAKAEQFANWEYIQASQEPKKFRDYIAVFSSGNAALPSSPFVELARARLSTLEDTAWSAAANSNNPSILYAFLLDFPDGRNAPAAQRTLMGLESRAWYEIEATTDPAKIEAFQKVFPNGHLASQAQHRLHQLRQTSEEEKDWTALTKNPTRAALEAFVAKHSLGKHVKEALDLLNPIVEAELRAKRWAEIKSTAYMEQLRAFLKDFNSGPEVDTARAMLAEKLREREEREWAKITDARTPAPVLQFLDAHPDGMRKQDAIGLLKQMPRLVKNDADTVLQASRNEIVTTAFGHWLVAQSEFPWLGRQVARLAASDGPDRQPRPLRFGVNWSILIGLFAVFATVVGWNAVDRISSFSGSNRLYVQSETARLVMIQVAILSAGFLLYCWRTFQCARGTPNASFIMAGRHAIGLAVLLAALIVTQLWGMNSYRTFGGLQNVNRVLDETSFAMTLCAACSALGTLILRRVRFTRWVYAILLSLATFAAAGFVVTGYGRYGPVALNYFLTWNLLWYGAISVVIAALALCAMLLAARRST